MNKKILLTIVIALFLCSVAVIPKTCYSQTGTLTVQLVTPEDQATSSTLSNVFTYIPTITGGDSFVSATLYVNGTATSANSTAITSEATNYISYDFASAGTYTWNVQVTSSSGSSFAADDFTLTVTVSSETPTPTAAPTETPTATTAPSPTATPTAHPTAHVTSTPTLEPTPTEETNQEGLNFLLIVGIAVAAVAVAGGVSAFFVIKKRVNEKTLRRFSSRGFQDWVINKFDGKPGDPASGIDGYTGGGQPLSIKQSDNVSLAEVEDFVNLLIKGRAQRGTIVAFNYDNGAVDGKLKAMDRGIELEMLSIYELLNKKFSSKIDDIAHSQVTFNAPMPMLSEEQGTEAFGRLPIAPQTEGSQKPVVFISYSNAKIVDQVKKMLEFLHYDYVVGDNEETLLPIPENKFGLMKQCDCAIINICALEQERRYSGLYVLNSNIMSEINAAYLKYNTQVVLLVERKVDLPPNFKGLKRIEYSTDDLSFDAAMELENILAEFRKI